jgi:large subunit ribosomal protein L4
VTVVDALDLDAYSTKRVAGILKELGLGDGSVLIVIETASPFVESSARNLPGVSVIRAEGLNVLDVLRHGKLVMTRSAVQAVERRLDEALRRERPAEQGEQP